MDTFLLLLPIKKRLKREFYAEMCRLEIGAYGHCGRKSVGRSMSALRSPVRLKLISRNTRRIGSAASSNWHVLPDGTLEPLTPIGQYTIERLKFWRPQLQHHRAWRYRYELERRPIDTLLKTRQVDEERRIHPDTRLAEIDLWLEPPIFNRPRG